MSHLKRSCLASVGHKGRALTLIVYRELSRTLNCLCRYFSLSDWSILLLIAISQVDDAVDDVMPVKVVKRGEQMDAVVLKRLLKQVLLAVRLEAVPYLRLNEIVSLRLHHFLDATNFLVDAEDAAL